MLSSLEVVSISSQPSCPFLQDGYQGLQSDTEEVSFSSFRPQGVQPLTYASPPSRELLSRAFLRDRANVRKMRIYANLTSCTSLLLCSSQLFLLLRRRSFLIFPSLLPFVDLSLLDIFYSLACFFWHDSFYAVPCSN